MIGPASLPMAPIPQRSSIIPMTTIRPPATSRPTTRPVPWKASRSGTRRLATSRPTATPTYMATPPIRGMGPAWTSRSRAGMTTLNLIAARRTSGVSRYVIATTTSSVRPYSRNVLTRSGDRYTSDQLYGTCGVADVRLPSSVRAHGHGGDFAQPPDRDGTAAQPPWHVPRQLDDRGRDVGLALPAVAIDLHGVTELLAGISRGRGRRRAGQVRTAHRHRPGLRQQF